MINSIKRKLKLKKFTKGLSGEEKLCVLFVSDSCELRLREIMVSFIEEIKNQGNDGVKKAVAFKAGFIEGTFDQFINKRLPSIEDSRRDHLFNMAFERFCCKLWYHHPVMKNGDIQEQMMILIEDSANDESLEYVFDNGYRSGLQENGEDLEFWKNAFQSSLSGLVYIRSKKSKEEESPETLLAELQKQVHIGRAIAEDCYAKESKEQVMSHKPKASLSGAKNDDEEGQFASASKLVQMQMMMASMLCEEQLSKMTPEQEKRYLAFELGVIEYFDRTFWRIGSDDENSDEQFFNFLDYYANQKYGDSSESVFQLWHLLAVHGLLLKERELGYDSVNKQVNPDGSKKEGHYPGCYLQDAVGIEL